MLRWPRFAMLSYVKDLCKVKKLTEFLMGNVRKLEKSVFIDIEALFTIICAGKTPGLTCAFLGMRTDVLWSMFFWNMTPCHWVICSRLFEVTILCRIVGSHLLLTRMHIPEERRQNVPLSRCQFRAQTHLAISPPYPNIQVPIFSCSCHGVPAWIHWRFMKPLP